MIENQQITELKEMIDLFEYNINQYKGKGYDETNTRADFIDKFFAILGWDMYNKKGSAEQYREVVREDKITIEGKVKAPDYCFRIGRERKFYVEAKKPSIDIKHDIAPAFQLRRYAYSAKLPLSILTDFEEFAVYDTRIKPDKADKASTARIFYCTYKEYIEQFDFISGTFSNAAIFKGSFDKYIEDKKPKKGTSEVDKEFLKLIEKWREDLAKNIALRNKDLSIYELNYVVQAIIDRIIFLRIAEARQMESEGRMQALLETKTPIYPELMKFFYEADKKYNSGLFDFQKDNISPGLSIDDRVFREIIKHLYSPYSPYEFSVLDVEILGNIYEQFLGKTIRLTPSHQAKVEDKPEVKKAGGVYYTPKYIVDYIVRHTMGEKIKDKKPEDIAAIKILDPACGSGSFLLGAYQLLLDYHLNYYTGGHADKELSSSDKQQAVLKKALKENRMYAVRDGEYRLTIDEKNRILLNNIFGVDIDRQAVEVTKLSLLLKLLEGESRESAGLLFKYSDVKLLPDLSGNIRCGNSLIGSDFYEKGQMSLFQDEDTVRRINVFDWKESFPEIFKRGGFDVIIGNPPYIRIQNMKEYAPDEVVFFKEEYKSASKGNYDIYVVFVEKGLRLLESTGKLGLILPHKFFNSRYGEPLRKIISKGNHLERVVHFGDQQIFDGATTYTCLLFLEKSGNQKMKYLKITNLLDWIYSKEAVATEIRNSQISSSEWNFIIGKEAVLFDRLDRNYKKLKDLNCKIFQGIITGSDKVFVLEDKDNKLWSKALNKYIEVEKEIIRPLLKGQEIRKYEVPQIQFYVIFPYDLTDNNAVLISEDELKKKFPLAYNYFKEASSFLKSKDRVKKNLALFSFSRNQNIGLMGEKKIILQVLSKSPSFTLDSGGEFAFVGGGTAGGYGIIIGDDGLSTKFILGLLNSSLLYFFHKKIATPFKGGFFAYSKQYLQQLPIYTIDFSNESDVTAHDKIVEMVDHMLELKKKLQGAKIETEKKLFERQINFLDTQIDQLVYQLYQITNDEIKIIEADTGEIG